MGNQRGGRDDEGELILGRPEGMTSLDFQGRLSQEEEEGGASGFFCSAREFITERKKR